MNHLAQREVEATARTLVALLRYRAVGQSLDYYRGVVAHLVVARLLDFPQPPRQRVSLAPVFLRFAKAFGLVLNRTFGDLALETELLVGHPPSNPLHEEVENDGEHARDTGATPPHVE